MARQGLSQLGPVRLQQIHRAQSPADPIKNLIGWQRVEPIQELRLPLRFQQVDLCRQSLAIVRAWTDQGDAPFRHLAQWIQRPEQGMAAQ